MSLRVTRIIRLGSSLLLLAAIVGCTPSVAKVRQKPTAPVEPIGRQMLRVAPDLKEARFSNLLNFESATDAVFVSAPSGRAGIDTTRAHTGKGSLLIEPGTGALDIKLASLLAGREFPGEWTLVGGYFLAERPVELTVSCAVEGLPPLRQQYPLRPGAWTAVMVELDKLRSLATAGHELAPALRLEIDAPAGTGVWCDDVTLIDNEKVLIAPESESAPDGQPGWTITRRGYHYFGDMPGRFAFKLSSAEGVADGWTIEEINPMRARFSSTGRTRSLTIYSDGRAYWDGQYDAMASDTLLEPEQAGQHRTPAEVVVPEELGRLERRSKGDSNNDGYNEQTGSYRVIASGPRLELAITPRTDAVVRPIFEIGGLPAGKVLATVEGKLVERMHRLEDGTLLLQMPGRIHRRTTLNVRVH